MAAAFIVQNENPLARERVFRDRFNPLDGLSDEELVARYRLSRHCILDLLDTISTDLEKQTNRSHAVLPIVQLTTALRFYATGSFQREVADLHGLSKASVSRCIFRVSLAIARKVKNYIKLPSGANEVRRVKAGFYNMTAFPNVIGVIDGTQIPIKGPTVDEPLYVCRKGYHAINVQVVCDSNLRLTNIVAKWPGSTHDAYMLNMSELFIEMDSGQPCGWLLGDSAYPLKPWLLTPILNPRTRGEQRYNGCHRRTRAVIERFNGVCKSRFRCLDKSGGVLQYSPGRCVNIIVATGYLHQICIDNGLPVPEEILDVEEDAEEEEEEEEELDDQENFENDRAARDELIRTRFS